MLNFLPGTLKGIVSFFLITINTILVFIPLMTVALFKIAIPIKSFRNFFSRVLITIASSWVSTNALIFRLINRINWNISGTDELDYNEWCLVVSNHQSWVDIFVIQTVLLGKAQYLKFFLKKELIWVPFMGVAWWALDFPFMKRYSAKFLEKHPELRGKDVEVTRKACEKFKSSPISIMNFVEGTRFTTEKHNRQKAPFTNLLKPKAGGIAFVLGSMGEYLNSILNVTIAYPEGVGTFWDFLCGRVTEIHVNIEKMPVTKEILGDYDNDPEYRKYFQAWVNELWVKKDQLLNRMLESTDDFDEAYNPDKVA